MVSARHGHAVSTGFLQLIDACAVFGVSKRVSAAIERGAVVYDA